jgi:Uma2 family endonuclease
MTKFRYRSADLELFPDNDGKRYEVIDGELYVSKQPNLKHQLICSEISGLFREWNLRTERGVEFPAPGVIFADDDDVAPDIVWVSNERLATISEPDGKLHAAPELVVEVLSPGSANARRDRQIKLDLYSRRGVLEYWIVDWEKQQVEIHRRSGTDLSLSITLFSDDALESSLLPGFTVPLRDLFARLAKF